MVIQRYPGAIWTPSTALGSHPPRTATTAIVMHQTYGQLAGDIPTLQAKGPPGSRADVHFEVARNGDIYQFLPLDSQSWHARQIPNETMIGIEHEDLEGRGIFGWTPPQTVSSVRLVAWLISQYSHIKPVRCKPNKGTYNGICGHVDLAGISGNDHTDSIPSNPGWAKYLSKLVAEVSAPHGSGDPTLLSLSDRLMLSGFGEVSAKQIVAQLNKNEHPGSGKDALTHYVRLVAAGFGERSAMEVVLAWFQLAYGLR